MAELEQAESRRGDFDPETFVGHDEVTDDSKVSLHASESRDLYERHAKTIRFSTLGEWLRRR